MMKYEVYLSPCVTHGHMHTQTALLLYYIIYTIDGEECMCVMWIKKYQLLSLGKIPRHKIYKITKFLTQDNREL